MNRGPSKLRIDKSQSCNEKIYDYIIIGAGPAGCFCAMQLNEAGKDVLIIEKNNINDGKVCGDGISMKCVNLLKQLDFPLDRFVEAGAAQIHKRIIVRNGKREVTHFGWDDGTVSFGIPRNKTDYIFRSYAAEKGVEIVYLTNVSKITKNKEVFSVGDFFAKRVIVACGSFSRLSILGTNLKYYPKNMAVGISTTIKCKCEAEPCFLFDYDAMYKGQYAWIFKTDDDNWNVGLWLRHDKNKLKAYFYDFINNKLPTYLGTDYQMQYSPKGAIMAIKKDGIKRNPIFKPKVKGIYFIGDANMTSDELEGEGIRQAIISGLILASKLTKSRKIKTLLGKRWL